MVEEIGFEVWKLSEREHANGNIVVEQRITLPCSWLQFLWRLPHWYCTIYFVCSSAATLYCVRLCLASTVWAQFTL